MAARLFSTARRASDNQRLAMLPRLEKASKTVAAAGRILTGALVEAEQTGELLRPHVVWAAVEKDKKLTRQSVLDAIAVVEDLVPDDDGSADAAMRVALAGRYATVRPFLALLGESQALGAASGGLRILAAVKALPELSKRKIGVKPLLPKEIDKDLVSPAWKRAVYANPELPEGAVDRDAYVVCVLEQLHRALGRRDIFATPSHRWSDPRARLLDGPAWEAVRADVLAGLSRDEPVEAHLAVKAIALDAAWKQMAARLAEAGDDTRVQIVTPPGSGRARLSVQHMDALAEPESLKWLRATCQAMLPRVDLPELLLEVHAWTGFLDAYVHLAEIFPRMEDLAVTVAALLVAEACNVGLTPVIKAGEAALTRGRLSHVDQYYVRAENHAAANAVLVGAQAEVPITAWWGGGLLASVDGLRFVVPVRTINAGPSPRYFGYKRGVTWLNAVLKDALRRDFPAQEGCG